MTGYEIKKLFESGFRHFFVAGFGSIYPASGRARPRGPRHGRERRAGRPARQEGLSGSRTAGREQLAAELSTTEPRHKVRSEFLALLYFAHLLPPARVAAVLDHMTARMGAVLDDDSGARSARTLTPGQKFARDYGRVILAAACAHVRAPCAPALLRELELRCPGAPTCPRRRPRNDRRGARRSRSPSCSRCCWPAGCSRARSRSCWRSTRPLHGGSAGRRTVAPATPRMTVRVVESTARRWRRSSSSTATPRRCARCSSRRRPAAAWSRRRWPRAPRSRPVRLIAKLDLRDRESRRAGAGGGRGPARARVRGRTQARRQAVPVGDPGRRGAGPARGGARPAGCRRGSISRTRHDRGAVQGRGRAAHGRGRRLRRARRPGGRGDRAGPVPGRRRRAGDDGGAVRARRAGRRPAGRRPHRRGPYPLRRDQGRRRHPHLPGRARGARTPTAGCRPA